MGRLLSCEYSCPSWPSVFLLILLFVLWTASSLVWFVRQLSWDRAVTQTKYQIRYGVMVSTRRSHRRDRGSIPRTGKVFDFLEKHNAIFFFQCNSKFPTLFIKQSWSVYLNIVLALSKNIFEPQKKENSALTLFARSIEMSVWRELKTQSHRCF